MRQGDFRISTHLLWVPGIYLMRISIRKSSGLNPNSLCDTQHDIASIAGHHFRRSLFHCRSGETVEDQPGVYPAPHHARPRCHPAAARTQEGHVPVLHTRQRRPADPRAVTGAGGQHHTSRVVYLVPVFGCITTTLSASGRGVSAKASWRILVSFSCRPGIQAA